MNDIKRRAIKKHNDAYEESKKPREEKPMNREEKRRLRELLILMTAISKG